MIGSVDLVFSFSSAFVGVARMENKATVIKSANGFKVLCKVGFMLITPRWGNKERIIIQFLYWMRNYEFVLLYAMPKYIVMPEVFN